MRIEKKLGEVILDGMETLQKLEPGSEQYKAQADVVAKLMDKAIDFEKLDVEQHEKGKDREMEAFYKNAQMAADRKDRRVKNILTGVGIGLPALITVWGALASWKFEETGTVASGPGREFMRRLFLRK